MGCTGLQEWGVRRALGSQSKSSDDTMILMVLPHPSAALFTAYIDEQRAGKSTRDKPLGMNSKEEPQKLHC